MHLELVAVGIVRVERLAHAVVARTDERTEPREALAHRGEVLDRVDLPGEVVEADAAALRPGAADRARTARGRGGSRCSDASMNTRRAVADLGDDLEVERLLVERGGSCGHRARRARRGSGDDRSHAVRNPLKRSTIPGKTSTKRSTSASMVDQPTEMRKRVVGVDAHRLAAPATAPASRTSTTIPSAPPRRAGRARAGSARPRRRRRRRTAGAAATPSADGSPKRSTPGTRSITGRGPLDQRALRARLPRSRSTSAHAAPNPTHAGTFSMPAAPGPLLRAADEERRDPQPAPHEQRAGALRARRLVRGHRTEVGAERGEVDSGSWPAAAHASTCTSDAAVARAPRTPRPRVAPCRPRGSRAAPTRARCPARIAATTVGGVEAARARRRRTTVDSTSRAFDRVAHARVLDRGRHDVTAPARAVTRRPRPPCSPPRCPTT